MNYACVYKEGQQHARVQNRKFAIFKFLLLFFYRSTTNIRKEKPFLENASGYYVIFPIITIQCS